MAVDIAPELYEQIQMIFSRKMSAARAGAHKALFDTVENGRPTYPQAQRYARVSGQYLSESLLEVLTPESLPNGHLYYNIAQKTLGQALEDEYGLVSDAAYRAQQAVNDAAGIGIKPIKPEFNRNRADGLIDLLSGAEVISDESWVLGEPVVNFSQNIVDESIKKNAGFQEQAGLDVRVIRKYDGVGLHDRDTPCQWCLSRAGSFSYDEAMSLGVFQRHEGCGCTIEYTSKKGVTTRSTSRRSGWS